MKYRVAIEDDISELVALMSYLGYSHTQESLLINFKALESHGGAVFVACSNDKVVGCVTAIIDVRFAGGVCGEIVSLVVAPSYRRKGVGAGLITFSENWLKTKTSIIRVRANVIREKAHLFYQELGFDEEKSQKVFKKTLKTS